MYNRSELAQRDYETAFADATTFLCSKLDDILKTLTIKLMPTEEEARSAPSKVRFTKDDKFAPDYSNPIIRAFYFSTYKSMLVINLLPTINQIFTKTDTYNNAIDRFEALFTSITELMHYLYEKKLIDEKQKQSVTVHLERAYTNSPLIKDIFTFVDYTKGTIKFLTENEQSLLESLFFDEKHNDFVSAVNHLRNELPNVYTILNINSSHPRQPIKSTIKFIEESISNKDISAKKRFTNIFDSITHLLLLLANPLPVDVINNVSVPLPVDIINLVNNKLETIYNKYPYIQKYYTFDVKTDKAEKKLRCHDQTLREQLKNATLSVDALSNQANTSNMTTTTTTTTTASSVNTAVTQTSFTDTTSLTNITTDTNSSASSTTSTLSIFQAPRSLASNKMIDPIYNKTWQESENWGLSRLISATILCRIMSDINTNKDIIANAKLGKNLPFIDFNMRGISIYFIEEQEKNVKQWYKQISQLEWPKKDEQQCYPCDLNNDYGKYTIAISINNHKNVIYLLKDIFKYHIGFIKEYYEVRTTALLVEKVTEIIKNNAKNLIVTFPYGRVITIDDQEVRVPTTLAKIWEEIIKQKNLSKPNYTEMKNHISTASNYTADENRSQNTVDCYQQIHVIKKRIDEVMKEALTLLQQSEHKIEKKQSI